MIARQIKLYTDFSVALKQKTATFLKPFHPVYSIMKAEAGKN